MRVGQTFNPYGMGSVLYLPKVVAARTDITLLQKLLYGALFSHCGKSGHVFPSQETLSAELGVKEDTIHQNIRRLVDVGLLLVKRPSGRDKLLHKTNRYLFIWDEHWDRSSQVKESEGLMSERPPSEPDGRPAGGPDSYPGPTETDILNNSSEEDRQAVSFVEFRELFTRHWEKKYFSKYPFQGAKDGSILKRLHTHFKGDRRAFKLVLKRYLACDEKFYIGHPLGQLMSSLTKFLADPAAPASDEDSGIPAPVGKVVEMTKEEKRKMWDDLESE